MHTIDVSESFFAELLAGWLFLERGVKMHEDDKM